MSGIDTGSTDFKTGFASAQLKILRYLKATIQTHQIQADRCRETQSWEDMRTENAKATALEAAVDHLNKLSSSREG